MKDWYEHVENFRHALAHRIPLYVPPYTFNNEETEKFRKLEIKKHEAFQQYDVEKIEKLTAEQNKLGKFFPVMTHLFTADADQVIFHAQILADWITIVELAEKLLIELRG